jgi:hypothetical protein
MDGPVSSAYSPRSPSVRPFIRPPGTASFSTTVTFNPWPARLMAADNPPGPAPTTMTWRTMPLRCLGSAGFAADSTVLLVSQMLNERMHP